MRTTIFAPVGLGLVLVTSAICTLPASADTGTFGKDWGYPGKPPGAAQVRVVSGEIAVSTGAIRVVWVVGERGLRLKSLEDIAGGTAVAGAGELFQVVLTDGTRYAASQMAPQGAARVGEVVADPKAARLAGRVPGRKVELSMKTADARLGVVWRAVVLDGANYVRQEIEIVAGQGDCGMQEVVWLDQEMGGRTVGSVEGSVIVCGNLFLGCEDPHARNEAQVAGRAVAAWTGEDLEYGRRKTRTWPLDASLLRQGENEVLFQYDRGPHRLDVWSVRLVEDDRAVAADDHHGRTGSQHVGNRYRLVLPRVKPGAKYELQADLSTDPDFKLPAGQKLDSQGRVLLLGGAGRAACRLPRGAVLARGQTLATSLVVGAAPEGQMRRAFLYYLERERAHPYRPYLHYNSWYDTAWAPFALTEGNCMEAIRGCGESLVRKHGVVLDGLVFDDGWDDPRTLWQFHKGFPKGFAPLAELCRQYDTRLGVWLSPFGGYGESKKQRMDFGRQQGYETNAAGFSLAGPKYYAAFRDACVEMIRRYGVNHFKFDGIAQGMMASGAGPQYLLDTEAMRRLMLELRREDPAVYINLTTGSWPSPFWLRFADSIWRQGGDMGLAGKGPRQQQWLTYRDQEVYRNIVRRGPLFPLNALMTQGVAYSRQGTAGDKTFNSDGFRDDVRAFFGSGTSLQELYIQPGRLTERDWAVLAEGAQWARAHADVLVDAHWVGGDPGRGEPYGYAAWAPRKGTLMLRNPSETALEMEVDVASAFELPPGWPTRYLLRSAWKEDAARPAIRAEAGKPIRVALKPLEVVVLEAAPQP